MHCLDTVYDLTTLNVSQPLQEKCFMVLGYWNPGDGGGGIFFWDSTFTGNDDHGTVLKSKALPPSEEGRWRRIYDGPVYVEWFGAKGNGLTDDTDPFNAAIAASRRVQLSGGKTYAVRGISTAGSTSLHLFGAGGSHVNGDPRSVIIPHMSVLADKNIALLTIADTDLGSGPMQTRVENIYFDRKSITKYGIRILKSQSAKIKNVFISGCITAGLFLDGTAAGSDQI